MSLGQGRTSIRMDASRNSTLLPLSLESRPSNISETNNLESKPDFALTASVTTGVLLFAILAALILGLFMIRRCKRIRAEKLVDNFSFPDRCETTAEGEMRVQEITEAPTDGERPLPDPFCGLPKEDNFASRTTPIGYLA